MVLRYTAFLRLYVDLIFPRLHHLDQFYSFPALSSGCTVLVFSRLSTAGLHVATFPALLSFYEFFTFPALASGHVNLASSHDWFIAMFMLSTLLLLVYWLCCDFDVAIVTRKLTSFLCDYFCRF